MKAEVNKLTKLVNVPTGLNNLKIKEDDLDVGKLKTVPVNLIHVVSHVVSKEFVKTQILTTKCESN